MEKVAGVLLLSSLAGLGTVAPRPHHRLRLRYKSHRPVVLSAETFAVRIRTPLAYAAV